MFMLLAMPRISSFLKKPAVKAPATTNVFANWVTFLAEKKFEISWKFSFLRRENSPFLRESAEYD